MTLPMSPNLRARRSFQWRLRTLGDGAFYVRDVGAP